MNPRKRVLALVPLLAAMVLFSGCGSNNSQAAVAGTWTQGTLAGTTPTKLPVIFVPGTLGSYPVGVNDTTTVQAALNQFVFNEGLSPTTLTSQYKFDETFFGRQLTEEGYLVTFKALIKAGYVPGVDLFDAAYDWRLRVAPTDDVADGRLTNATAQVLMDGSFQYQVDYLAYWAAVASEKWQAANPGQPFPGIIVISHSLGNLVSRAYVQSAAYGSTYTDSHGQIRRLPPVKRLIMLAPPNQGASFVFNVANDNFMLALDSRPNLINSFYKLANPAFANVATGTLSVHRPGQPDITRTSITNPLTGQPDARLFLSQYAPFTSSVIPTDDFLDGTNVNNDPTRRNLFLLDVNGGSPPNAFANTTKVSVFYGNTIPTLATVSTHSGPGGLVLSVGTSGPPDTPRSTQPGEVWYSDNILPAAGDGVLTTESMVGTLVGNPLISLMPQGNGVTHGTVTSDPGVLDQVVALLSL